MARRKRKQIKAEELDIYKYLVEELSSRAEFADYDMSTIRISVKLCTNSRNNNYGIYSSGDNQK